MQHHELRGEVGLDRRAEHLGRQLHRVGLRGGLITERAARDADDVRQRTGPLGGRHRRGHGHLVLRVDPYPQVGPGGRIGCGHVGHMLDDVEPHDGEAGGDEGAHGRGPDGPRRAGDEHHVSRHPAIITITRRVPIAPDRLLGVDSRL